MSTAEAILEKVRALPPEKQAEVLDFVEFLRQKSAGQKASVILKGIWQAEGIHITEEDMAEARREMWGNFPRDFTDAP